MLRQVSKENYSQELLGARQKSLHFLELKTSTLHLAEKNGSILPALFLIFIILLWNLLPAPTAV